MDKMTLELTWDELEVIQTAVIYLRACLKSFDKKDRAGDNRKKQAGVGGNASIPK